MLGEFVRRYPDVVPDLHFDNRQVDLVAEGFDLAIGGGIELTEAMARVAATGMGIAMLPLQHALPLLESVALVRVLREWYAETRPLSLYYTSRKLVPAKVRVFVNDTPQAFQASGQATRFGQK